jgi:Flp pilus assembly protein TadD
LFNIGQMEDALTEYSWVVELSPASRAARVALVGALADTGRWVEAAAECRRALDNDPTDSRPPHRLAAVLYEHQRDEEAIALFYKAIAARTKDVSAYYYNTKDVSTYYYLAFACVRTGRHAEAIPPLRKVTELSPTDVTARQMLASALIAVGRPEEAIVELRAAIDRMPTAVVLCKELGTLLRARAGRRRRQRSSRRPRTSILGSWRPGRD